MLGSDYRPEPRGPSRRLTLFRKCVAPMRAFIVPIGCSIVSRRRRIASGFASSRCCTASSRSSCSHRVNPSLRSGRALGFDRTILTGVSPVTPQHLVGFFVCIAIRQSLPGRATIGVFLGQIDKVLLTEASVRLGARSHRLGQSYRDRPPFAYLGTAFWPLLPRVHRSRRASLDHRFRRRSLCHIAKSTCKEIASYRIQGCGDLFAGLSRGDTFAFESFRLANIVHG